MLRLKTNDELEMDLTRLYNEICALENEEKIREQNFQLFAKKINLIINSHIYPEMNLKLSNLYSDLQNMRRGRVLFLCESKNRVNYLLDKIYKIEVEKLNRNSTCSQKEYFKSISVIRITRSIKYVSQKRHK